MQEEVEDCYKAKIDLAAVTQAFETKFIKKYQCLPELWDPTHSDYTNKYRRGQALEVLLKIMKKWDTNATSAKVRQKINIMRSCYRKDLRKHLKSKTIGPNGEEIYKYNPKNWKFHALRFLGGNIDRELNYLEENSIAEINLDSENFDDGESEEEEEEENEVHTSDMLQILTTDETHNERQSFKIETCETEIETCEREIETGEREIQKGERKIKKRRLESEVLNNDYMFDKELQAISSNVACKLKRMNPNQRCYAELLINKVLIGGLQNSLTDETDLTEIYKYIE